MNMDPTPVSEPNTIFSPIADSLEKWGIDSNSNPTDILGALNSKLPSLLQNLPEDYIDPVFNHKLTPEQENQLQEINIKFQKDYVDKHKVALQSLDLLIQCMKHSERINQEVAGQIQEHRQKLSPFCRQFTLFDLYNCRDFSVLDPKYEDHPIPLFIAGPNGVEIESPNQIDIKTALFDLTPIADGPKSRQSKGKKKKQEIKAKREAQIKRGFVKTEKPMSKSQLKKQAQLQARIDAQNKQKDETAEKNKEQLEDQQSQTLKSKKQLLEEAKKQKVESDLGDSDNDSVSQDPERDSPANSGDSDESDVDEDVLTPK